MNTFVDGNFSIFIDGNIKVFQHPYNSQFFYYDDAAKNLLGKINVIRDENAIVGLCLPECKIDKNRVSAYCRCSHSCGGSIEFESIEVPLYYADKEYIPSSITNNYF